MLSAVSYPALACRCAVPAPGLKTPAETNRSTAIFEGTVESIRLQWPLIDASEGAAIDADLDDEPPILLVSFRVSRTYRGASLDHVELRTGCGGGDCGFDFQVGKEYLVYAYKDENSQLATDICTETGLLSEKAMDLAYLRGESLPKASPKEKNVSLGKICGRILRSATAEAPDEMLGLFRDGRTSPVPDDQADVNSDGSFCFENVPPGSYRMFYGNNIEDGPTAFAFFPGVLNASAASLIEVAPGQSISGFDFTVPIQEIYRIAGTVNGFTAAMMQASAKAVLLRADVPQGPIAYSGDISEHGKFEFPRVLPGRYWAVVTVDPDDQSKWLTRKVAVDVEGAVKGLRLDLFRK